MKRQEIPTLEQAYSGTLYGTFSGENQIVDMEPSELLEIEDQPFHPYPPDQLAALAESIRQNGQLQPCIVRKLNGQYVILAGRNRKRACELIGCKVKCMVVERDQADANLILTDTNLFQRNMKPSELAKGYQMQKEALEAKGQRESTSAIARQTGEDRKTIQRYLKLARLSDPLLRMVDENRIPVSVGLDLADQTPENQTRLAAYLTGHPERKLNMKSLGQLKEIADWNCDNLSQLFDKKKKPKSPSRFEQVMPILCDQYCRYSVTGSQEELDAHCGQCVLAEMLEQML